MEKLKDLKTKAEFASYQFQFAKLPSDIRYWNKEVERLNKLCNKAKQELYQGSGVLGNTPSL